MTHFVDENTGRTLCGLPWDAEVWRSDLRADCVPCQDVWAQRGWTFPLPALVGEDTLDAATAPAIP